MYPHKFDSYTYVLPFLLVNLCILMYACPIWTLRVFFNADFVNTRILIDLASLPSHPLDKEQDSVLGKFRCHKIPLYTIHKVNPDLALNFGKYMENILLKISC